MNKLCFVRGAPPTDPKKDENYATIMAKHQPGLNLVVDCVTNFELRKGQLYEHQSKMNHFKATTNKAQKFNTEVNIEVLKDKSGRRS